MAYPQDGLAYTLDEFVAKTQEVKRPHSGIAFEVEEGKFLQVNMGIPGGSGEVLRQVMIKVGSMVAYEGEIKFVREGLLDNGVGNMLKKHFTGEDAKFTIATANGAARLFLAHKSKRVTVLRLQPGETLVVAGDQLLAFEPTVSHTITMMKKMSSIVSGGLFNVKLQGVGFVALMTRGTPVTLMVAPGLPTVFTAPHATVAWSGELTPDFKTDISLKTFLGRGSGESFQMKFDPARGRGFVVVQPGHEEEPPPPQRPA